MKKNNVFKKLSDDELRKKLTEEQYNVTQKNQTERPFTNKYWDNKEPGIYVDLISGEPLFSTLDQYTSNSGWPSFTKPIKSENVSERQELSDSRTEVRSSLSDSHLGHVFNDGPNPTGLRYCINSAALKFIPVDQLEQEGYGEYKKLFEK